MPGVVINVTVAHGGTGAVADDVDEVLDDWGFELVVVHGPRACGPCRANKDPRNVPCAGCVGNIARIDPDDAKGNLCRCTVKVQRKRNRD